MPAGKWRAKFDALCKDLMHHIDNEEGCVFTEAQEVLSDATARKLATEMTRLVANGLPASVFDASGHSASGTRP